MQVNYTYSANTTKRSKEGEEIPMNKEKNTKTTQKAKEIVEMLSNEGFSMGQAYSVLQQAEGIIREASVILTQKKTKTALKDVLGAAEDYSSKGKSPSE